MMEIKLEENLFLNNILLFEEIDSTSKYAKREVEELKNGSIIWAKKQTDGVGRLSRPWESKEGKGLYFTIVFKNSWQVCELNFLTNLIAYCLSRSLEKLAIDTKIKWPNDLYLNGKKIAGILVENIIRDDLNNSLIGIGINVNQNESDFTDQVRLKAGSIFSETGKRIELYELLEVVLKEIERELLNPLDNQEVVDYIKERSFTIGKYVDMNIGKDLVHGRASDILYDGSLVLNILDKKKIISFGEIINQ